jgi:catechol 2,3-dioxygenase-like lactoylglutathione lyase family enzyme
MAVQLNHTIVAARDKMESAKFLAEVLGLPAPVLAGPFAAVQIGDTALDFRDRDDAFAKQHYAFLVSDAEFVEIFARIQGRGLTYWADPMRKKVGETNKWDDGRGVYFDDPGGHLLEVITRPYGSGGTEAENPHPLLS